MNKQIKHRSIIPNFVSLKQGDFVSLLDYKNIIAFEGKECLCNRCVTDNDTTLVAISPFKNYILVSKHQETEMSLGWWLVLYCVDDNLYYSMKYFYE